jgi:EmrB/QacA subfamily drug resistance transporter
VGRSANSPGYKWAIVWSAGLGAFMMSTDQALVGIALPSIGAHFDAGFPTIQWVLSAYLLVSASLLLPVGRATDVLGQRRVFLAGIGCFVIGSVLAATAPNVAWIFAARGVQAIGTAGILGTWVAIAASAVPSKQRGRALGTAVTIMSVGGITGPALSGVLVDSLGWRSIFFADAAVGLVAFSVAYIVLPAHRTSIEAGRRGLGDWRGMLASAVTLVAVLFAVSRGNSAGWSSPFILSSAAIAAVGLASFIAIERRAREPIVDLSLFRQRAFTLGILGWNLTFFAIIVSAFLMPFYLQGVLGYTARAAGFISMTTAMALFVVSPISGRLSDRIGSRILGTAGMTLGAVGLLVLSQLGEGSGLGHVIPPLAAMGASMAMFGPPNTNQVLGCVPRERYGMTSALLQVMRNSGQAMGVAVTTLIVTLGITSLGIDADIGLLREEGATSNPVLIDGFVKGLERVFLVGAGVAGLAALCSLLGGRRRSEAAAPEAAMAPVSKAAS